MPIVSTDIKYRLSGGASQSDPALSLGGVVSSVDAGSGIFDNVGSAEAAAGDIEYRCVYVKNNHGSLTLTSPKIWIQANTPSGDTNIEISLGTSAVNGTEQTIADENTAPSGTTFSAPANEGAALSLGDLAPGATKAVWIKRTVTAAAAAANDTFNLRVKGDTLP
jgi:hypothetical protein